jgi:hypothetical protein
MVKAIFWIAFISVAYVCVGYPLLLIIWRRMVRRRVRKRYLANLCLPYGLYRVFSLCQVLFYCMACVGGLISTYPGGNRGGAPCTSVRVRVGRTLEKIILIPYTFALMNWAAVAGLYYFAHGSRDIWNPVAARAHRRHAALPTSTSSPKSTGEWACA